jgi:hypothetical protein
MDINKMVMAIIGLVVAVIVVATVLLPTIEGLDAAMDPTWLSLFQLVGILAIIGIVLMAVKTFNNKG